MKRKILHISLIIALAFATTGVSISKHFCGERLVEISVNEKAVPCCGTESNCCQTEMEFFQLDDDFTQAVSAQQTQNAENYFNIITISFQFKSEYAENVSTHDLYSDLSPPPSKIPDLSLQQTYLL